MHTHSPASPEYFTSRFVLICWLLERNLSAVGPTMEPEWLLACHGAVGAVRACGAVLPDDDREGEQAAGKATRGMLRKVVQAEFERLDACKDQVRLAGCLVGSVSEGAFLGTPPEYYCHLALHGRVGCLG